MKHLITAAALLIATILITSCGSRNNSNSDADYDATNGPAPINYQSGPDAITPQQLDEMILFADDLGSAQAVGALDYLHTLADGCSGKAREVIMRKYVDLYGIALDNNGDEMRGTMNQLRQSTGTDLRTIYDEYVTTLRVGDDDGGGNPEEAVKQTVDSAEIHTADPNQPNETPAIVTPEATITTNE